MNQLPITLKCSPKFLKIPCSDTLSVFKLMYKLSILCSNGVWIHIIKHITSEMMVFSIKNIAKQSTSTIAEMQLFTHGLEVINKGYIIQKHIPPTHAYIFSFFFTHDITWHCKFEYNSLLPYTYCIIYELYALTAIMKYNHIQPKLRWKNWLDYDHLPLKIIDHWPGWDDAPRNNHKTEQRAN